MWNSNNSNNKNNYSLGGTPTYSTPPNDYPPAIPTVSSVYSTGAPAYPNYIPSPNYSSYVPSNDSCTTVPIQGVMQLTPTVPKPVSFFSTLPNEDQQTSDFFAVPPGTENKPKSRATDASSSVGVGLLGKLTVKLEQVRSHASDSVEAHFTDRK
jgi:hypothetical protein